MDVPMHEGEIRIDMSRERQAAAVMRGGTWHQITVQEALDMMEAMLASSSTPCHTTPAPTDERDIILPKPKNRVWGGLANE